jgi:Na+-transporting methylmalonyl-CoA/oxaloacetate decarboxylase gamma subunit
MSTGVIIGIVVLILLFLAMIGYAMSRSRTPPVVPKPPALI